MSFKRNRKHKQHKKYNTKKMLKQIKGGIGPASIFSSISNFIKLTRDTSEELNYIYQLKKELQDNSNQIKKDVDEYSSIYNKLFKRTQGLYSKIDNLTDIQSQCSQLNPNQITNTSSDNTFSFGEFFNKAKNTVSEETTRITDEGNKFATSIANQIPFTDASELQTKIEELKKEIISLNQEITQLKSNHENEQNIISSAFKNPVSDNDLNHLDSSSYELETKTPSVLEEETKSNLTNPFEQPSKLEENTPSLFNKPVEEKPASTNPFGQPTNPFGQPTNPFGQPSKLEENPNLENPNLEQPNLEQPNLENPNLENPNLEENEEQPNLEDNIEQPTQEEPTISQITEIPETNENKKQNAGKRRYYGSKKRKYKRMNNSRNRKNIERFYL